MRTVRIVKKIEVLEACLYHENNQLKGTEKNRKCQAAESRVINELKRLKFKKCFESQALHPIAVRTLLENGAVKLVKSFRIEIEKKMMSLLPAKYLTACVYLGYQRKVGQAINSIS